MVMATKVSNCGHDENYSYRGGAAGDQSGTEYYIRDWYYFHQNCVLRHPDAKVRAMIAEMAKAAANNNCIGYDQSQRLTFWEQLKKAGYKPQNIKVRCEADCSSSTAAIVKGAGYRLKLPKLINVSPELWTGNEKSALQAAGFAVLTGSKYTQSGDYLLAGDINLNEQTHTNIVVTNGSKAGSGGSTKPVATKLDVDGYWGKATTSKLQQVFGTPIDGEVWHQWLYNNKSWCTTGWKWDTTGYGSALIRAMQRYFNSKGYGAGEVDGLVGAKFWNALMKHTGKSNGTSAVVRMQAMLNEGKFKV